MKCGRCIYKQRYRTCDLICEEHGLQRLNLDYRYLAKLAVMRRIMIIVVCT